MGLSVWVDHDVETKVIEVLQDVPVGTPRHHFGRPYLTAYQLAIELDRRYPQVASALGQLVGGAGIGQHNSLAQYLARELSRHIRDDPTFSVEGGSMSSKDVRSLIFDSPQGPVTSSLTGSGFDLSMFRLSNE